jgi:hypothetical protein
MEKVESKNPWKGIEEDFEERKGEAEEDPQGNKTAEEEPIEDQEDVDLQGDKDPEEEPEPEDVNNEPEKFLVETETGTKYRDIEAVIKGTEEKDRLIQELKDEALIRKAESGIKESPKPNYDQLPPSQISTMTLEQYEESLLKIEEEQGETAKLIKLTSDVFDHKLQQRDQQTQYAANEFNRYSSEMKKKYGSAISDDEIKEGYELVKAIRSGKGNPIELISIQRAKRKAKEKSKTKNKTKVTEENNKLKRAANSTRIKPNQANPGNRTSYTKLEERKLKAREKKNVGEMLDVMFEMNKPENVKKRTL